MEEIEKTPLSPLARYHEWIISWTKKKKAEKALASFSFAESSFFPIPVDLLLAAMISSRPEKTKRLVHITAVSSILGGLFGYLIGALLINSVGAWLINTYNLQAGFATLGESYNNNAFLAVLAAAFTPLPYKIITISAGAFSISLVEFITASIIGRYLRFGMVGWFSKVVGVRYKHRIEFFINVLSLGVIALIILVLMTL